MPTTTSAPQFKFTAATAGAGALGIMFEMLRGTTAFSENVMMALLICVTLIGVSFNLARGLSKYVYVAPGAAPTEASAELKVTAGLSGAGVLPLLIDLLQPGANTVSDKITITILCCVATLIVAYNISCGLSTYEPRGLPMSAFNAINEHREVPPTPPGALGS